MKIKYWGDTDEKGLTMTASLFNNQGEPVHIGFPMTETAPNSAIYITENIFNIIDPITAGVYVIRVEDSLDEQYRYRELIFNGVREVTLLEIKFMTEKELMQLRDAIGIDGAKMVARGGQLQKKSEEPYNKIVDTNEWRE